MSPIDDDRVDDADTERTAVTVDADDDDPPYNPPNQAQVLPWWA